MRKDIQNPDDLPRYPAGAPHRDDEASKDGARLVNRTGGRVTQCDFALAVVQAAGPRGIRANDVYTAPDSPFPDLSTCRARLSDLKKQGKIGKKGERTEGNSGVRVNLWVAAEYLPKPDNDDSSPDLFDKAA
ncbi:hypothetical protein [Sphingopyxis sp.]|jgi:hypothetical protein|uniref:hypothetical protein n=1 Tax=Sphingopyxis sp. TaxID=1908224 RepID=UPI00311D8C09